MKTRLLLLIAVASFGLTAGAANAEGCLKGAAVGGVAGHLAGHHGVAGAAIGCAVGHHQAKVKAKKEAAQANAAARNNGSRVAPGERATPVNKSDI
jgi:hypothetical protein